MSAFGTSGHPSLHRTCPLLGVKRTWACALHMKRREFITLLGAADIRVEPAEALDLFQRLIVTRTMFLRGPLGSGI